MPEVELSAGTIDYGDTGGAGPAVVLLHGVMMDGALWREVVPGLRDDFRCITPTLPLGAHRRPMRPGADLSVAGLAKLVAEFLEALDLRDAVLVLSDWGGAQALVALGLDERIGRLVLTSCEAFENYPPGLPGRNLRMLARVPGTFRVLPSLMGVGPLQRLPVSFGWMSRRLPRQLVREWMRPMAASAGVRRDLRTYCLGVPPRAELLRWSEALTAFDRPALVVWAAEDRVMPPEHGRRLAALLPDSVHVEIPDSYTLIPVDQPGPLTEQLRSFLGKR